MDPKNTRNEELEDTAPSPGSDEPEHEKHRRHGYRGYPNNPNIGGGIHTGSGFAGVCSPARNVVGLMPHPERACHTLVGSNDGTSVFESLLSATVSG